MPVNTYHTLVLDTSGIHFFCCGHNLHRQLGCGDSYVNKMIFTQVNLPIKFIDLSAGLNHSLGIA
jgi:alpha-tubulin suppressor-like RCC1 family protein